MSSPITPPTYIDSKRLVGTIGKSPTTPTRGGTPSPTPRDAASKVKSSPNPIYQVSPKVSSPLVSQSVQNNSSVYTYPSMTSSLSPTNISSLSNGEYNGPSRLLSDVKSLINQAKSKDSPTGLSPGMNRLADTNSDRFNFSMTTPTKQSPERDSFHDSNQRSQMDHNKNRDNQDQKVGLDLSPARQLLHATLNQSDDVPDASIDYDCKSDDMNHSKTHEIAVAPNISIIKPASSSKPTSITKSKVITKNSPLKPLSVSLAPMDEDDPHMTSDYQQIVSSISDQRGNSYPKATITPTRRQSYIPVRKSNKANDLSNKNAIPSDKSPTTDEMSPTGLSIPIVESSSNIIESKDSIESIPSPDESNSLDKVDSLDKTDTIHKSDRMRSDRNISTTALRPNSSPRGMKSANRGKSFESLAINSSPGRSVDSRSSDSPDDRSTPTIYPMNQDLYKDMYDNEANSLDISEASLVAVNDSIHVNVVSEKNRSQGSNQSNNSEADQIKLLESQIAELKEQLLRNASIATTNAAATTSTISQLIDRNNSLSSEKLRLENEMISSNQLVNQLTNQLEKRNEENRQLCQQIQDQKQEFDSLIMEIEELRRCKDETHQRKIQADNGQDNKSTKMKREDGIQLQRMKDTTISVTEQLCDKLYILDSIVEDRILLAHLRKYEQKDDPYSSTKGWQQNRRKKRGNGDAVKHFGYDYGKPSRRHEMLPHPETDDHEEDLDDGLHISVDNLEIEDAEELELENYENNFSFEDDSNIKVNITAENRSNDNDQTSNILDEVLIRNSQLDQNARDVTEEEEYESDEEEVRG